MSTFDQEQPPSLSSHLITITRQPEKVNNNNAMTGSSTTSVKAGFTRVDLNRSVWEVPSRYTTLASIGHGAYGQVCSALDTKRIDPRKVEQLSQQSGGDPNPPSPSTPYLRVAIKKLTRPFQSEIHAKRTYRELLLLKHMKHENVIGLLDIFSPSVSSADFNDIYFVTHFMGADLNQIIRTQKLSDDHVQFLVYQILRGLKYIHSAGIIHRDLKPSNLVVNEECDLKIVDFGLARQAEAEMTGYVATRWYRAPEIMLNWMHYDQTVDVWSVGCIMAELISGKTLFPGTDHINQLERIMAVCGTPDADFMTRITSEDARAYLRTVPVMKRKDLREVLGRLMSTATQSSSPASELATINPHAISLLNQMLNLDPAKRPTAEAALAHPYLAQYADPTDEPTCDTVFDETFEEKKLSLVEWKQLIWNEVEGWRETSGGGQPAVVEAMDH